MKFSKSVGVKVNGTTSNYFDEKLRLKSKELNIPMTQIIGVCIAKSLDQLEYDDLVLSLPDADLDNDDLEANANFMDYLKNVPSSKGLTLGFLNCVKEDFHIHDTEKLLQVVSNCLSLGRLETEICDNMYYKNQIYYKAKGVTPSRQEIKRLENEAKEYEQFLKWKKKFKEI